MKYILVRRIESYHQCYWRQTDSVGVTGGPADSANLLTPNMYGIFLYEFNPYADAGQLDERVGSSQ